MSQSVVSDLGDISSPGGAGTLTACDVVDRTLSEYLFPAGINRPTQDRLTDAITDSALTFAIDADHITQMPEHSLLEMDEEITPVRSYNPATEEVTVWERGYGESVAAAHLAGAAVRLNPEFYRVTLLNALNTILGYLFAWGVYKPVHLTTLFSREPVVLDSTVKAIISARVKRSSSATRWRRPLEAGREFELMVDVNPPELQFYSGGAEGADVRLVVAKDYNRPVSCETVVDGPADLINALPMAVAGQILQGREIPRLNIEEIRRLIAIQGAEVPPGTTFNVAQALLQAFKSTAVMAERARLDQTYGTHWEWVP